MAKQRRLNKNVIASITAGGIVLAIIVVALATFNAARRDPEMIARKAKAQEEAGDWRRALRLYQNAFNVKKEAKYLLEGARVARKAGDLGNAFGFLNLAYAQSPDDPEVLNLLLAQYWEIRDLGMGGGHWIDMLERADRLLKPDKEPNNTLALGTKLEALEWLRLRPEETAQRTRESDETLERILQLDANDPYLALARAQRARLRVIETLRDLSTRRQTLEFDQAMRRALTERWELLKPAVAAHPEHIELRISAARALADLKNWAEARQLLEEGLAYLAERGLQDDPDLHYEFASVVQQEIEQSINESLRNAVADATAPVPQTERARLEEVRRKAIDREKVTAGLRQAEKAIELEPALYRAYRVRADLQRLQWEEEGVWASRALANQRSILESYAEALRGTINLESFRAVMATFRQERLDLIGAAFDTAIRFYRDTADPAVRSQAKTYMVSFLQESESQFPEQALTHLMKGYTAEINQELRQAAKAFAEAEKQAEKIGGNAVLLGYRAKEELARLYRSLGEPGLALLYLDQVIAFLEQEYQNPAPELQYQRALLLLEMGRAEESLPILEQLLVKFPKWPELRAAQARALTMLGKGDQALTQLKQQDAEAPSLLFAQAVAAASAEDYGTAATLYGRLLEQNPNSAVLLERYLRMLEAAGREEDARAYVRGRLERGADPQIERTLQAYQILYSEQNPEARLQKQLELLGAIPDEFERAAALFNFWTMRNETSNAQFYLDQMSQMRPDDVGVLRMQFEVSLRAEDCAKAEKYARRLAEANADQAGGAFFRGRYLLACGDSERALSEFRTAAREFPNDSELKRYTARALMNVSPPRYDEAIQILNDAIRFDPRNFDARKLIYACYELIGRRTEGIPHLEKAAELARERGLKDPFIEERAQFLDEEKNPRAGVTRREEIRTSQPQNVNNLLRLAELYVKVAEPDQARERYLEAIAAEPTNLQAVRAAVGFFADHNAVEDGEKLLTNYISSSTGLEEILGRVLLARFYELIGNNQLVQSRESLSAGMYEESKTQQQLVDSFRQKALEAIRLAQDRVPEALAGANDDERRRATLICASELASFYRRTERWQDMIEAYRAVITHLGKEDVEALQMARLSIIAGLRALRQYAQAKEAIQAYRADFPSSPNGLMAEVELLMTGIQRTDQELKEARQQARELLLRLTNMEPGNPWYWYMLGLINLQEERYTDARAQLLQSKELAPEGLNLAHRLELARLYELMGRPEMAEAELRSLLELDRGGTRDVELRLIDLFSRTDQVQRALEFVNQLKARDPRQPFWPYQLGRLLLEQEQYSAAATEFQRAVELTTSSHPKVIEDWMMALLKAKRAREVITVFERLSPAVLTPPIKAVAAEAYRAENRADVSIPLLEQALSEAGRFGLHVLRDVTQRTLRLVGPDESVALIRRLLGTIDDPGLKTGLRMMLAELFVPDADPGRRAEAATILNEIQSQYEPAHPLYFETLLTQALLLDREQQPEEAVKKYESALSLRPDDLRGLNNMAYLLADRLNRPQEALPYAQRLHQGAPGNPTILDTVGWVFFLAGNAEQALQVFQEAQRLAPDYIAVRYHMGLVLERLDRRSEALRELHRGLELARESKDDEYLSKLEEAVARIR